MARKNNRHTEYSSSSSEGLLFTGSHVIKSVGQLKRRINLVSQRYNCIGMPCEVRETSPGLKTAVMMGPLGIPRYGGRSDRTWRLLHCRAFAKMDDGLSGSQTIGWAYASGDKSRAATSCPRRLDILRLKCCMRWTMGTYSRRGRSAFESQAERRQNMENDETRRTHWRHTAESLTSR